MMDYMDLDIAIMEVLKRRLKMTVLVDERVLILHKDGDSMGVSSCIEDEHEFWNSAADLLNYLIEIGRYEHDWEFQLSYWLPDFAKIADQISGRKRKIGSSKWVSTYAGNLDLDVAAYLTKEGEYWPRREALPNFTEALVPPKEYTNENFNLAERVRNDFTYHPPKESQPEKYKIIRNKGKDVALIFVNFCPSSRELSTALTKLEEAVFWANAAIARNE